MKSLRSAFSAARAAGFAVALITVLAAESGVSAPSEHALTRMTLTLVGRPPTAEERSAFTSGSKTLAEIAAGFRTEPVLFQKLTDYWLEALKIRVPVSILAVRDVTQRTPDTLSNLLRVHGLNYFYINDRGTCNDPGSNEPVRFLQLDVKNNETGQMQVNFGGCTCDNATFVNPFFAPAQRVATCAVALEEAYCGPALGACFPFGGTTPQNSYERDIDRFLTYEPGLLIAKSIVDERAYDDIVRSSRGLGSGAYLDFIRRFSEKNFAKVIPASSYPDRRTDKAYTEANPSSANLTWVDRGKFHAGILTTMAFHYNTPGWRAKFHRVMNTLLCREFAAPASWVHPNPEEGDLTKRAMCKDCHAVLEPGARFFGRWPDLGKADFFYDASVGVSAIGNLDGTEDVDTVGLGRVLSNTRDLYRCGVKHAFRFLMNRPMTGREEATMLEPLTNQFIDDGKKLWPIMLKIIDSPGYRGEGG